MADDTTDPVEAATATRSAPLAVTKPDLEDRLRHALTTGGWLDLRVGEPDRDDPNGKLDWAPSRHVPAETVVRVLTEPRGFNVTTHAVRIRGAHIEGDLDLEYATTTGPLIFEGCRLDRVVLEQATAVEIRIEDCRVSSFSAVDLRTAFNLVIVRTQVLGGVDLAGAHIGSQLDLSGAHLSTTEDSPALNAENLTVAQGILCTDGFTAEGEVRLMGAHIGGQLHLSGAQLRSGGEVPALNCDNLIVDQDMFCTDGFTAEGGVRLLGAHVGGQLAMTGARLHSTETPALDADTLTVIQGMFCTDGFSADGGIRLVGAHIGGHLDVTGAQVSSTDGTAFDAENLRVDQAMLCSGGLNVRGGLRLVGARIGGQLDLSAARLSADDGPALDADTLTVDQGMMCRDGFRAEGGVRLSGAHIGGPLDLSAAHLESLEGPALDAESLVVDQHMVCSDGFTAEGGVQLAGARIGIHLNMSAAHLRSTDGRALDAETLIVGQAMFCRDGFRAEGGVRLSGAHIGLQLDMSGAYLSCTDGPALLAESLTIGQHLFCRDGFTAEGEIALLGTRIGGHLDLSDAHLRATDGPALNAGNITVGQSMFCHDGFTVDGDVDLRGASIAELEWSPAERPAGLVDLTGARIGRIADTVDRWPEALRLDGLTYDTLQGLTEPDSVPIRLKWLELAAGYEGYRPQTHNRLASAYRAAGVDDSARDVLLAKQRARTAARQPRHLSTSHGGLRVPDALQHAARSAWDWFLTYTIGYGYRPGLILYWLAAALIIATGIFAALHPSHVFPADSAGARPSFNPFLYSLDLLLPVASLGQRDAFITQGLATWLSAGFTITGWLLGAVLVAGLGGVFKRD